MPYDIYINYRRDDTLAMAVVLEKFLHNAFTDLRVFLDQEGIQAEQYFRRKDAPLFFGRTSIPQYVDASKLCEHRSPDGKLLRALTKIGVYLGNHNFWIINSKNPKGEYETTYFPYFDPPGKERYFQGVAELKENLRLVKQDNKWGFTDDEGHTVIQIVLDAAEPSADGYIRAKYQGKRGVLKNPRFDYFKSFEKGYL